MKLNVGKTGIINFQVHTEPDWFGCEPCTASTSSVLPGGTDTGFCVPETCRQTLQADTGADTGADIDFGTGF